MNRKKRHTMNSKFGGKMKFPSNNDLSMPSRNQRNTFQKSKSYQRKRNTGGFSHRKINLDQNKFHKKPRNIPPLR